VEIEAVAANRPRKLFGSRLSHKRPAAIPGAQIGKPTRFGIIAAKEHVKNYSKDFYRTFIAYDCSMVEVNPLSSRTKAKSWRSMPKLHFDDNALYRHPEIAAMRDDS